MPNWCKYSITLFIVIFSPRGTKSERSRVESLSASRVGLLFASRTSGPAVVLDDTFDVETFACPPGHQAKTLPLAELGVDGGVAVSATTLIGDEGDINRKVRPHAAIPSTMAR